MLRINTAQAAGHLTFLWLWTLDFSPKGDLSAFEPAELSAAACYPGDPDEFVAALRACRWLEEDGMIHDWGDYTGRLIVGRAKAKERMRKLREAAGEHLENDKNGSRTFAERSANVPGTVPYHTVPNSTEPNPYDVGVPPVAIPTKEAPKVATLPPPAKKVPLPVDDEDWIKSLEADPTYTGLNVREQLGKMTNWCRVNGKQANRKRFTNWLNRSDKPLLFTQPQQPKKKGW